jgi:hypothetical protein
MIVRTPSMKAQQDRSISIDNLTEVVVTWRRLGLTEDRLIPFQARRNIADANDRP